MMAKLSDFYVTKVLNAMYTLATVNDSLNFYYVTGPITRTIVEDAIDYIADTAGAVKAVVGRRTALAPITKFAGYRIAISGERGANDYGTVPVPSALEEIRRTGWFGTYYGANFIALEQVYDNVLDLISLNNFRGIYSPVGGGFATTLEWKRGSETQYKNLKECINGKLS
jgi:hypothetical protein